MGLHWRKDRQTLELNWEFREDLCQFGHGCWLHQPHTTQGIISKEIKDINVRGNTLKDFRGGKKGKMSFSCQGLERVAKVLTVLTIAKMELFTSIAFRDLCSAKRHNENMAELDPATWMVLLRQPQEEPHRFPVSSWKCLLSHTTWHEWALSPVTHVWDLIELLDSGFHPFQLSDIAGSWGVNH